MGDIETYKMINSWDEETKRIIFEELLSEFERPKSIRCPKCGTRYSGVNDGVVLGSYTFLDPSCDFSSIHPEGTFNTKLKYQSIKIAQQNLVHSLITIRKLLEDYGWTIGKYYDKICITEDYAKSYTKTFERVIEAGDYFDKLSAELTDYQSIQEALTKEEG